MTGILALQGAFSEHQECLDKLNEKYVLIRQRTDLKDNIDRLIFPGGESTTQRKLIKELNLFESLKQKISDGIPVLATCAGLILLAEQIENEDTPCFQTLPVTVVRNGYGRQSGSFSYISSVGSIENYPMRFIRAPYIKDVMCDEVEQLSVINGRIVAVKYHKQIGLAFHPELTEDLRIHKKFLKL